MTDAIMDGDAIREIAKLAEEAAVKVLNVNVPAAFRGVEDVVAPFVILKDGNGAEHIGCLSGVMEKYRVRPDRIVQTVFCGSLDAFISLVNRHKQSSAVFYKVSPEAIEANAVIDYHDEQNLPNNCQHIIRYNFPFSDEYKLWKKFNGAPLPILQFAEFIENNIADIAVPLGDAVEAGVASLLQCEFGKPTEIFNLSRGISMRVETKIGEVHKLASGEMQVKFEEEHADHKDRSGAMVKIPGMFIVQIPLFAGGPPVRLIARLRYNRCPSIVWSYHFFQLERLIRAAVQGDIARIREETDLACFEAVRS